MIRTVNRRSTVAPAGLALALLAGCAGSGSPTVSFDGEECTYSGPESVEQTDIEFTYTNTSSVNSSLAFLNLTDESGRSEASSMIGTRTSVTGEPPPAYLEMVGILQAAPGDEVTQTAPLVAGTYFLDCVTFSGELPDEVWRAAELEVSG